MAMDKMGRRVFKANVLRHCGVSNSCWYQWLGGHSEPTADHAQILINLSKGALTMDTLRPRNRLPMSTHNL